MRKCCLIPFLFCEEESICAQGYSKVVLSYSVPVMWRRKRLHTRLKWGNLVHSFTEHFVKKKAFAHKATARKFCQIQFLLSEAFAHEATGREVLSHSLPVLWSRKSLRMRLQLGSFCLLPVSWRRKCLRTRVKLGSFISFSSCFGKKNICAGGYNKGVFATFSLFHEG